MLCSANEVAAMLRKAGVGCGLPTGLAVDAAAAAVWLERNAKSGFEATLAAFEAFSADPTIERPRSILFTGPSLADQVVAAADGGGVTPPEVQDLALLLGYLGRAADDHGLTVTLRFSGGSTALLGSGELVLTGELSAPDSLVVEARSAEASSVPRIDGGNSGIEVTDGQWARAASLAALTYVPATDESRLKGAGAGLDDND